MCVLCVLLLLLLLVLLLLLLLVLVFVVCASVQRRQPQKLNPMWFNKVKAPARVYSYETDTRSSKDIIPVQ
jgi:hypothetical protein